MKNKTNKILDPRSKKETRDILTARSRPKTAGNWLVSQLREAIISGELVAGSAIRQDMLAEKYEVSRMPVRQALDVLAAEGWVVQRPHKGAVVADLNADDVIELFEVRTSLEKLAIARSFPNLTEEQIEDIEVAWNAYQEGDGDSLVLHQQFHLALYAAAGPRLIRLLMQQLDAAQRYLRFESSEIQNSDADQAEHIALIEAAKARDVAKGIEIIEAHVSEGGHGIAEKILKRGTDPDG